ncbi:MAG: tripartite tricarboxylate transporter substrate binding protein [Deltaproteobacteria bacterium]|nr:tripartite tricarboxylate transporter substrate binding protein [Deltaproteobacteria bacterium]
MILFLWATPVLADQFPSKAITIIVPYAAGGSTDVVTRILAEETSKFLGQPVVVENRTGGGGTVGGATMAATAKPDGYTIAMMPITMYRYPHMMKVNWDPLKDFTYVIHVTGYTFGVVVKADAPWKTWNEFIAYAKANPGKVTYATPGAGTTLHITMEMLAKKLGIKWIQVPMKGGAETTPAVLGGHVTATADSTGWAPQVDAGQLRLLVTWGNTRTKRWPNSPTLKELGYGVVSNSPFGIAGPKRMDPKVVKILHDAFKKGMETEAFQKILAKFDMEPFYKNSEDYTKFVKELYEEEKQNVENLGLKKK